MRKVFFSFDWDDVWRVNQIRNSWVAKGSYKNAGFIDSVDFEEVKKGGDKAIKQWIDNQLKGTSVTVVLVGEETDSSKYVNYEIQKSIEKQNGLIEIYIHSVKDQNNKMASKGGSPFKKPPINFSPHQNGILTYPCCSCYDWINDHGYENMGSWIEKAAQQAGK